MKMLTDTEARHGLQSISRAINEMHLLKTLAAQLDHQQKEIVTDALGDIAIGFIAIANVIKDAYPDD